MKLQALRTFRYAGRDQQAGDVFDASDKDGALFKKLKWAADDGAATKSAADLPAEVMARSASPESDGAEDMPKMVATQKVNYGGKTLNAGDEFEATERDAKRLREVNKAEDAPDPKPTSGRGEYQRRDMVAEPKEAGPTGEAKSPQSLPRGRRPKNKT